MMANRNNDNNETWFLFRPWLNDRSFPKGRLPSKAEKKPYHDASLMRMLTPGDAGLFTYVMPVTARLTMLIRDLADEESSEYGGNAKIIPLAVIEYLYASLVKLREQQERIRESLNDNYMGNEQLRAINLSCIKLFKAIPLLKSADQFTNELRMNFATGILQIVDCPYAEMAFAEMAFIDKIEAVHAALSICPKLLENRQHTLTCQNILLMATKHRQYPHDVDDNQTVIDVSIIFANQLPLHELPRLMLALASNKCYLGNMAVSHMNQLYENRLAMATELRAKTVSTHSNAY